MRGRALLKLPDGRYVHRKQYLERQRLENIVDAHGYDREIAGIVQGEVAEILEGEMARGRTIPHAARKDYERYDFTYRKGRRAPQSSKLPWDFSQ